MNGFDIILLALLAGFIALRLRSELGKKTGNEPGADAGTNTGGNRVTADERTGRGQLVEGEVVGHGTQEDEQRVVDMEQNPALRAGFADIRKADRSFDPAQFLHGARSAYQMILEAFWAGDRQTLRDMLADDVAEGFIKAIDAREEAGETVESKLVDIDEATITKARLEGRMAEITVKFESEIIYVTRDGDGDITEGDPSDVVEVTDRWTFARNTASDDPSWTLVATRSG
ncbi:Tim44/TimA family putative adaptor protein [Yunchengibacter salinarum]|uniref:Tim44/TimA family putative adaptor protein n=1 Tax=Yunchengibacter salinarum TaxID=3133399 RepID=UPI0035B66E33